MNLIGVFCIGLVWGWLARQVHRPATRPELSMAILLFVTAAVAAYYWYQIHSRGAFLFALASLLSAMSHGAFTEEVKRRSRVASP